MRVVFQISSRNPYSIQLLNNAVNFKTALHMNDDEIKTIVDAYWKDFMTTLTDGLNDGDNTETFLKIILKHYTAEEMIDILTTVDKVINLI